MVMDTLGDIYIIGSSALEYWRWCKNPLPAARREERLSCVPQYGNLWRLDLETQRHMSVPIHLAVGDARLRRNTEICALSVHRNAFPAGSFVNVLPGIHVASPELCFVQMARYLSFAQAIALGYEFCGIYAPSYDGRQELSKRQVALTTPEQLSAFCSAARGIWGRGTAAKACRYVRGWSASPMETAASMLLCLPCRHGGMGLPQAELNHLVNLTQEARALAGGRQTLRIDLYWPEKHFGVEYDGRLFHEDPAAFERDRMRANALGAMGVETLALTAGCLREDAQLEAMARSVARRMGVRMHAYDQDWRFERWQLRRQLFGYADGTVEFMWPGLRRVGKVSLRDALKSLRARDA